MDLRPAGGTLDAAVRTALAAVAAFLCAGLLGGPAVAQEPPQHPQEERPDRQDGEHLFLRDCAMCHGHDGTGTSRGPDITDDGTAGTHFMLTTGYMPLSAPNQPLRRKLPFYTDSQIQSLVEYVGEFVDGPEVPLVEPDRALLAEGGELFRLHCAACHQFIGTGGVLIGSNEAPTLHHASETEVVEALRFGPGTMPQYSVEEIDPEAATAIATFIAYEIQRPRDEGGIALGHFGPWSEGFVAWFGGLGSLLVVSAWIGKRT